MGHIDYVSPQVDASTGTLAVRGVFENKDRALLPGLFARVRAADRAAERRLLVPDAAIGTNRRAAMSWSSGRTTSSSGSW